MEDRSWIGNPENLQRQLKSMLEFPKLQNDNGVKSIIQSLDKMKSHNLSITATKPSQHPELIQVTSITPNKLVENSRVPVGVAATGNQKEKPTGKQKEKGKQKIDKFLEDSLVGVAATEKQLGNLTIKEHEYDLRSKKNVNYVESDQEEDNVEKDPDFMSGFSGYMVLDEEIRCAREAEEADNAKLLNPDYIMPMNSRLRTSAIKFDVKTKRLRLFRRIWKRKHTVGKNETIGALTYWMLEFIRVLCVHNIIMKKRDAYYLARCNLKREIKNFDSILEDVACTLEVDRTSLFILAKEKGNVMGRLVLEDNKAIINCTKVGVTGCYPIPPLVEKLKFWREDAKVVILVEAQATLSLFMQPEFYNIIPSIIMSSDGQASLATRWLLSRLMDERKIPVVVLVDCDPDGIEILLSILVGSRNQAYHNKFDVLANVHWLGLRPSQAYEELPTDKLFPLSPREVEKINNILSREYLKEHLSKVYTEVKMMSQNRLKCDLQAFIDREKPDDFTKTWFTNKLGEYCDSVIQV